MKYIPYLLSIRSLNASIVALEWRGLRPIGPVFDGAIWRILEISRAENQDRGQFELKPLYSLQSGQTAFLCLFLRS